MGRSRIKAPRTAEFAPTYCFSPPCIPNLRSPRRYRNFVTTFRQQHPGTWREAQPPSRDEADDSDARIRLMDVQTALQQVMDSIAEQFSSAEQASVLVQYAFTPAHPKVIAYLTANFLHGGW